MPRLIPNANTVVMRLYNVGLGDCFLLAFPTAGDPTYMVIDCGIAKGTPDEKERMEAIVSDILDATGGRLNILAVTHEHYDHVSGFAHAEALWKQFQVEKVWLPWIEKEGETEADDVRKLKMKLNDAALKAVSRGLTAFDEGMRASAQTQAGFLGLDASSPFGVSVMDKAYDIAKGRGPITFLEPGDVKKLPNTEVNAFVLGPPRHKDQAGNPLVKRNKPLLKLLEDEEEMYSYSAIGIEKGSGPSHSMALGAADDNDSLFEALSGVDESDDFDRYCPFDSRYRVPWDEGMVDPFFQKFYSADAQWRRVDEDWLASSSELALKAGDFTNNISLVLAFRLPNSNRVLLFPGDAQVGNWLSWHSIKTWKVEQGAGPDVTTEQLLNDTVFYKVGHHGSHNATIREKGLEMMAKGGNLVAYVPVSVPVAHDIMNYCPMPFYPIMVQLKQKTNGNVFLGTGAILDNAAPNLPPGITVQPSASVLPAMVKNGKHLEDPVPMYLEVTISD